MSGTTAAVLIAAFIALVAVVALLRNNNGGGGGRRVTVIDLTDNRAALTHALPDHNHLDVAPHEHDLPEHFHEEYALASHTHPAPPVQIDVAAVQQIVRQELFTTPQVVHTQHHHVGGHFSRLAAAVAGLVGFIISLLAVLYYNSSRLTIDTGKSGASTVLDHQFTGSFWLKFLLVVLATAGMAVIWGYLIPGIFNRHHEDEDQ